MPPLTATPTGTLMRLRVQPRARVACLEGVRDGAVRLRLTAPPVDGAANVACLAFLAKVLRIPRGHLQLQAGATSRDKLVHVTGLTPAQVANALGVTP